MMKRLFAAVLCVMAALGIGMAGLAAANPYDAPYGTAEHTAYVYAYNACLYYSQFLGDGYPVAGYQGNIIGAQDYIRQAHYLDGMAQAAQNAYLSNPLSGWLDFDSAAGTVQAQWENPRDANLVLPGAGRDAAVYLYYACGAIFQH